MELLYFIVGFIVTWFVIISVAAIIALLVFWFVIRQIYCGLWYSHKLIKYDLVRLDIQHGRIWKIKLRLKAIVLVDYFNVEMTLAHRDGGKLRKFDFRGILPVQVQ